jgi:hypothetical protein
MAAFLLDFLAVSSEYNLPISCVWQCRICRSTATSLTDISFIAHVAASLAIRKRSMSNVVELAKFRPHADNSRLAQEWRMFHRVISDLRAGRDVHSELLEEIDVLQMYSQHDHVREACLRILNEFGLTPTCPFPA